MSRSSPRPTDDDIAAAAATIVDQVESKRSDTAMVRTGLKLRPEVHAYFRDRAHANHTSIQKTIEKLCNAVYAQWQQQEAARAQRAARQPEETP